MTLEEILKGLERKYPEGPPSEEQVRSQTVRFRADAWLKRWPENLEKPSFLVPGEEFEIDRQRLFDMAGDVHSPSDSLAFYVWVAGWGTGTKARSVGRSAKVLNSPDLAELLWKSFSTVHELGAVEAYRQLRSWDHHRIKYFGPAFFTKWIYFAAYDSWDQPSPAPLILDKNVALSLNWKTSGWSAKEYSDYLNLATELQENWAPNSSAHVVEYAFFHTKGLV